MHHIPALCVQPRMANSVVEYPLNRSGRVDSVATLPCMPSREHAPAGVCASGGVMYMSIADARVPTDYSPATVLT